MAETVFMESAMYNVTSAQLNSLLRKFLSSVSVFYPTFVAENGSVKRYRYNE
jgi:hypothetical protein